MTETKKKSKFAKLNWKGAGITFLLCAIGALANKNVDSFLGWAAIQLFFTIPICVFVLIVGRKDE